MGMKDNAGPGAPRQILNIAQYLLIIDLKQPVIQRHTPFFLIRIIIPPPIQPSATVAGLFSRHCIYATTSFFATWCCEI
ncbi:hypothetical protein SAMN04487894_11533 [Niabella drilacis]|uniref:Uncharacterized protein n=1 Tax=Niabella drilacis (strain DSM 25811 / CCM 8410 / CCUG 62505 / LMG 26954 / E90) TaxID=1285928 RepID=A0A1G6Y9E5_NIADE|nr:hypothetical protein SAMN04487894_11533 [Niabella drilacis]